MSSIPGSPVRADRNARSMLESQDVLDNANSQSFNSNGKNVAGSPASSILDGSINSALTEGGQSVSSLGGLNHVNDGVSGSTVQRRMSRAYDPNNELLNQQLGSMEDNQRVNTSARARALSSGSIQVDDTILVAEKESCWKTWLRKKVPMYGWLYNPGYSLINLPDDLIAGITISTVVIPQSMAYAMLAPLPPVYGLYTSVVPILIYCIFGTSRHMHTGTFAITTLLLGQAVRGLMAQNTLSGPSDQFNLFSALFNDAQALTMATSEDPEYERRFIGMLLMLSFVVGLVQVIMSFLRVGGWASKHLLPDALVGGFNTAAVFHIGTSQLKHFLGIKSMPSSQGAFALLKSWIWIATHFLEETNWYTVLLGSIAIIFMLIMRKLERKRKAAYEIQQRKKEMMLVQQRQAISAAIARDREQRRGQQPPGTDSHVSNNTLLALYSDSPSSSTVASSTSLRTAHGNLETGSFSNNTREHGDVEQALVDEGLNSTTAEDHQIYIPIPDILLAVIILTIVNVAFSLDTPRSEGGWGIDVIGPIPKGLPKIIFPASLITSGSEEWMTLEFVKTVLLPMVQPGLLIAVIIYVMSFSIAKQFGKRYGYKVDPNQEMLALGLASMGGSIFSGYACTGSLTRTAILAQSGGKTPLASMVGVMTVTLTLVCLTWCFERVPNAVLAAIVLVALQSLIMQINEPFKLWRLGQQKASFIWSVTFVAVLIISVELGIGIGIGAVLLSTAYSWFMDYRHEDEPLLRNRRHHRPSGLEQEQNNNIDRQNHRSGVRLSAPASPVLRGVDWKTKMMRTKWGGRIGSFFGLERPIFSDSTNTDDEHQPEHH
ncbi:hypothetical protein BX616_010203 [Lobosporangium transversale]|uniref:Sulfate transporter family-domain-containing protein n=1 Tax=Lobosporangium transversale TaxID=64571 RepID=A0A1Y2GNE9_9FUNG|nr:sulfate transporter family-domain-containing protein [Lobosporangium transversale]KAF9918106.1 hypothetical protein BX616_010203 [Lobosporangium transversale]ORZ14887.1 sulfate transporter family-domain-containing protein [Lobosporangium transversale]|eukprot:XP_021881019.1 sulfate transporter family-domain-containing protein [Lobosporangium transversale]